MKHINIIAPSYNNKQEVLACLEAFGKQTHSAFTFLLCIDGSTDGTAEAVIPSHYSFSLLVLEHADKLNHGRNATRNLAFPYLHHEYTLFWDTDIVPEPDLLEQHLLLLQRKECISMGNVDFTNRHSNNWAAYISSRGYNKFRPFQEMEFHYVNMGNVALRTSYYVQAGGMDAQLIRYGGDDTELAIRLHHLFKLPIINNTLARGKSVLNKTLDFALQQMTEFGETNLPYIYRKHPAYNNIYACHLMSESNLKAKGYRIVLGLFSSEAIQRILPLFPLKLRNQLIHYLVAQHLYRGFKSSIGGKMTGA